MTEYQFGVSNPALKKEEEEEEFPWTQVICLQKCRTNYMFPTRNAFVHVELTPRHNKNPCLRCFELCNRSGACPFSQGQLQASPAKVRDADRFWPKSRHVPVARAYREAAMSQFPPPARPNTGFGHKIPTFLRPPILGTTTPIGQFKSCDIPFPKSHVKVLVNF